jgi:translation initiation factor 6
MRIEKFDFKKEPNIGLFCFSTDSFCLSNFDLSEKNIKTIKNVLNVPLIQTSLLGTPLVGIFAAGNSNGIIVSNHIFDEELEFLKKKINVLVLQTH